jgi:hypothetical protein
MGKHRDPKRHDTNPFGKIFRTIEPAHGRWADDDPGTPAEDDPVMNDPAHGADSEELVTPKPVEPDPEPLIEIKAGRRAYGGSLADLVAQVENAELDPELPDYLTGGFDAVGTDRPDTRERPKPAETMIIGAAPVPPEPPPDVNQAEYEDRARDGRRSGWLPFFAGSVALCVALAGGWYSHSALSRTAASEAHSPVQTATKTQTVTATPKPGGKPQATVTAWRTAKAKPKATVRVTTTPPPGPTVFSTRTVTPEPRISVRVETRSRPGPTVTETQTERCVITIYINRRTGVEIDRTESGSCG